MNGSRPPRPVGSSREAVYQQWVYDTLTNQVRINDGPQIKVKRTSRGVHLELSKQCIEDAVGNASTIVPRWG